MVDRVRAKIARQIVHVMTFYRDGNGDYVNDAVCCMSVSHFFSCLVIRLKARVSVFFLVDYNSVVIKAENVKTDTMYLQLSARLSRMTECPQESLGIMFVQCIAIA